MPPLSSLKIARRWILLIALIAAIFFATSSPDDGYSSFQFPAKITNISSVSASSLIQTCSWVCVERVPPGCQRRGNPWDVCACVRQEYVCTGPPDPTISGILTCSAWGTNGWCIGDESLDLVATVPGGENVLISGSLNGETFACGPEAGSVTCSISLPEGSGTVTYLATSAQGTTAGGSKSWQRDATLPVIDGSITGTNGDNGWFISPAEVSASVTESGSGLSAFETSLDNTNWTAYTAPLTFNDGVYTLNIRAIDVAGNIATVDLPINVDTVSPTIDGALSGTMGAANWYNSAVQASSAASDATSGIGTFESSSSGGAWTAYTAPLTFEDGIHTVTFKAVDVAGNSSETALYSFKVDTSAPHINLPSRWYIWESITFEASEKTSGFTDIEMQIMDSQGRWKKIEKHWSTDQDSFAYTILWNRAFADGILAPIGNYPVVVRAWDEAGNMSEKSGQIIIPQPNAAPLPTFTPTPVQEIVAVETEESEATQEVLALVEPEPAPAEEEKPENEKKESIFTLANKTNTPTTSDSPITNPQSPILWGATASAAIGAFAAQIAERKRREAEAEAARKRAEREYQKRVWAASASKLKSIGRAYQRSLDKFKQELIDKGVSPSEAARQKRAAMKNGSIHSAAEVIQEYREKQALANWKEADMASADDAAKKVIEDKKLQSFADWKEADMAVASAAVTAQKTAEATQPEEEKKSWWEKTVDWVDDHQVEMSLGIGAAAAVAAVVISSALSLPLILAAAPVLIVAGIAVGVGTMALNAYAGRNIRANMFRNLAVTGVTTLALTGAWALLQGVPQAIGGYCVANPVVCKNVEPILNFIDAAEEKWLVGKAAYQTWRGDDAGAFETNLELQAELLDAGMPGNSVANELGYETLELIVKYGDDAVELVQRYGDDAAELIFKYGDDAIYLLSEYGDDAFSLLLSYGDDAVDIIGAYGDEGIEILANHGHDAIYLIDEYGDDTISLFLTYGDDAIDIIGAYGSEGIEFLSKHGDDAISLIRKYGDSAFSLFLTYDDDVIYILEEYGDKAFSLLLTYGDDAIDIIGAYGNDGIKVLSSVGNASSAKDLLEALDDDVLDYVLEEGTEAIAALSRWSKDDLIEYGPELALRATRDADVLRDIKKLTELDPTDPNYYSKQADLIRVIAANSTQYAENGQVVLGKWVDYGNGFTEYARNTGSAHYNPHPDMWNLLGELGDGKRDETAWLINQQVIQTGVDRGEPFEYSLSGLSPDKIELEEYAIEKIWEGGPTKEKIYDNLKEALGDGYVPIRLKELVELHFAGYKYSLDSATDSFVLIKP